MALAPNDHLVVVGPSGIGKSSLLRVLATLDPLAAGELRLNGRTPDEIGIPKWRRQVTYVASTPPPLPHTARDWLITIGALAAQRSAPVDDAYALAADWGVGLELWDQPWSRLSGGERQRLALAVAVSRRPLVLLLDEPTANLDPASVERVEATLADRTCVWVTHDPAQADRVGSRHLELG
jgi:putative ABC transport system ATP-binding protein